MGNNFMESRMEIEMLLAKKCEIFERAANSLAEALIVRANKDGITAKTKKDILNALDGFSENEKVEILTNLIIKLLSQTSGKGKKASKNMAEGFFRDKF